MSYPKDIKFRAEKLRKQGHSIDEIARVLHISPSTVSLWVRHVMMDENAKGRIVFLRNKGREKGNNTRIKKRKVEKTKITKKIQRNLSSIDLKQENLSLLCSFLYWGEGAKSRDAIKFINSDPQMIRTFLHLFRATHTVDEKKFRVCVHLHEYHDKKAIMEYWSTVTNIPLTQFMKPYRKPNTGKNIREGHKGCICVNYYDSKLHYLLMETYRIFSDWLLVQDKIKYSSHGAVV